MWFYNTPNKMLYSLNKDEVKLLCHKFGNNTPFGVFLVVRLYKGNV